MSELDIVVLNGPGSDKLIKTLGQMGSLCFLLYLCVCVCVFQWDLLYIPWESKTGLSVLALHVVAECCAASLISRHPSPNFPCSV